jgi:hypothetical protein
MWRLAFGLESPGECIVGALCSYIIPWPVWLSSTSLTFPAQCMHECDLVDVQHCAAQHACATLRRLTKAGDAQTANQGHAVLISLLA